ncbi:MAG: pantetheine-phosphate adenylyltransferase [Candidatus Kappaea frigidicola]|nr:pantetheine-phosphate adenylyltransferase [Candidatus Kappaea frigidicola]
MKRKAVYPGTFDPITYGHLDLLKRATKIFDEVVVAVAHSVNKAPLFSVDERVSMVKKAVAGIENVKVDDFNCLVVDYMMKVEARTIIRGIRMISDFEFEFQMALTNRQLNSEVETIFMMPHESYCYLSSKLIKEAVMLGADVKQFVPKEIAEALTNKLRPE